MITFPSPPRSPQPLWPYPLKGKQEKKPIQFVLPIYSVEHGQTPSGQSLKENSSPSLPTPLPEAIVVESYTSAIFISIFKISRQ